MSTPIDRIMDDGPALAAAGFYWRCVDEVKVLACRPLEEQGFVNGFSTRLGGVSPFPAGDLNLAGFDEDSSENIYENRRRFLGAFPAGLELTTVWQVHGADVKTVETAIDIKTSDERADALISSLSGVLVGVKTADCVPVLLCDPETGSYAAIHAGWRGTAQSICSKTFALLVNKYGARPEAMFAAIGPAAGCQNYEIGSDVIEAFAISVPDSDKYFEPTSPGHALVDLHRANRDQLIANGIPETQIFTAPFCTMDRPDLFFSYRLEKRKYGRTGRLLSVIGRVK